MEAPATPSISEHQAELAGAPWLWPVDYCHLLAHGASIVLLIMFRHEATDVGFWCVWNVFVIGLVLGVARSLRRRSLRTGALTRLCMATVIIPIYFTELGALVTYVNPANWEQRLFDFDLWLCRGNPLEAIERVSASWLTELLQWVYDFYYFIPLLLGVAVWKQKRTVDVSRMIFALALCIYLSYLGYYLVPATGPNIDKFGLYDFQGPIRGLFLAAELRETLFAIEKIKHNCFPSGHTAVSLLSLMLAWRFARPVVPVLLPLVAALIFSTLYLRYHYVADVLSGILLAVGSYALALWLHRFFELKHFSDPTLWSEHGDPN
ncbi:MAG: phosphatase PAP2 family protein [Planctomycetota bacterium]